MKKYLVLSLVMVLLSSCSVLSPNFLAGKWIRSSPFGGTDSFTFTDDSKFVAKYAESESSVVTETGSYTAGFTVVEIVLDSGEKRALGYTMYRSSIDIIWQGQTMRLHRLK